MKSFTEMGIDQSQLESIRRSLHQIPEIGLEETRTSGFVAERLHSLGYKVHKGLAGTGVVGTLENGTPGRALGLRADMDGLPILEKTGLPYASRHHGKMHACGHDGHMAMLLGAAEAIARRRRFSGIVNLIFQPAEETVGGAKMMVEEGLFKLFPCDAVFALHNMTHLPLGQIAFRDGPIMAAVDEARVTVHGRGGHGARPEDTADPIVAGAGIVLALQTIVSRDIQPYDPAVVTVGAFQSGSVSNIIPNEARLVIGIRSFDPATRDYLEKRIKDICRYQAESYGMTATVDYQPSYDATVNHGAETRFLRRQAVQYVGGDNVINLEHPVMGSEDFCYMLQACPGSMFFIGTQSSSDDKPLHHPEYDFNDDVLSLGAGFWTQITETYLAPSI